MAQLRSFKSLDSAPAEQEAAPASGGSGEPASSTSSIVSMVGGNLTRSGTTTTLGREAPVRAASGREDDQSEKQQQQQRRRRRQEEAPAVPQEGLASASAPATKVELGGTLKAAAKSASSSEEDQVVEHELELEDEEGDGEDAAASSDDEAVTRIGIESSRAARSALGNVVAAADDDEQERQEQQQEATNNRQQQQQLQPQQQQQLNLVVNGNEPTLGPPPPPSGAVQRPMGAPAARPMSRQHASSPALYLHHHPLVGQSPRQRRLLGQLSSNPSSDSLSQYSVSGLRNGAAFEVRWRNIYLMAKKSRVPRLLDDSALYRLFRRATGRASSSSAADKGGGLGAADSVGPQAAGQQQQQAEMTKQQQQVLTGNAHLVAPELFNQAEYEPILSNISGSVLSGQLTAILGPSGVGKTSLLRALTGRNQLEGVGRVQLLGETGKRMQVVTVPQDDVLPEKLTVAEDLYFTSRLKNTAKGFDHQRNIRRIVRLLQLDSFTSTRIEKLSGGQCRRLSIGRELLSCPDIVILDEPTSGLDANTCRKIIVALRDLAENGGRVMGRPMSIIVTIHQPQIEVYNLFHRIYVMALGGRAIYEGPPSQLLSTLVERSSLSKVCAVDQLNDNPAVVAIEVASGEYGQQVIEELAANQEQQAYEEHCDSPFTTPRSSKTPLSVSPRFQLLHRAQRNSSQQQLQSLGENSPKPTAGLGGRALFHVHSSDRLSAVTSCSYASTYDADLPEEAAPRLKVDKRLRRSVIMRGDFLTHTLILMKRTLFLTTRNLFLMSIRLIGFTMVALSMVQFFADTLIPNEHICPQYQTEVTDLADYMLSQRSRLLNLEYILEQLRASHMFFFHLILSFTMVTSAIAGLTYPYRMRMFLREHKNGWYSSASFIVSQTLAELPVDFLGPAVIVLIVYPLCNQPYSEYYWRQLGYLVVIFISCIITRSHAEIASTFLIDSVEHSVFVACVLVTPPTLLSGITNKIIKLPTWLQIASYGSSVRYTFESLLVLRFGYGQCPCEPELVHGYPAKISTEAMPAQLDSLARGLFELNAANETDASSLSSAAAAAAANNNNETLLAGQDENIFQKFVRLVQDSGNLFVPKQEELGQCDTYRSLILHDKGIEDRVVLKWMLAMLLMFVILRCLAYIAVRTVIKTRR